MHALLATVQALAPEDLAAGDLFIPGAHELEPSAADETWRSAKISGLLPVFSQRLQQQGNACFVYDCRRAGDAQRQAISSTHAQMMLTDLPFMTLVQQDERRRKRIRHSEALVKNSSLKMTLPPHAEEPISYGVLA